jgi:nicotinate-nucleotide pyrophosphorylase (carboxylating)
MPARSLPEMIDALLDLAIEEDVGDGDVTTDLLVPAGKTATGHYVARQGGVFAGEKVLTHFFQRFCSDVKITALAREGECIEPGRKLATITGSARAILTGERLSLNLLQRMCGVATLTRSFVDAVEGTGVKIMDTRKTMPGQRAFDRLAVFVGGGENHRAGLYDMILIKDNHLALTEPKGSVADAVRRAREKSSLKIMLEVDTLDQLSDALEAEPDMVLLDNMSLGALEDAVKLTHDFSASRDLRRPLLEASGGVSLKTVRGIAETGVDRISVGALTHSAVALDIGLDFA